MKKKHFLFLRTHRQSRWLRIIRSANRVEKRSVEQQFHITSATESLVRALFVTLANCLNMSTSSGCSWPIMTSEWSGGPRSRSVISDRVDTCRHWLSEPTLATPMHTLPSFRTNSRNKHTLDMTSVQITWKPEYAGPPHLLRRPPHCVKFRVQRGPPSAPHFCAPPKHQNRSPKVQYERGAGHPLPHPTPFSVSCYVIKITFVYNVC